MFLAPLYDAFGSQDHQYELFEYVRAQSLRLTNLEESTTQCILSCQCVRYSENTAFLADRV